MQRIGYEEKQNRSVHIEWRGFYKNTDLGG